MQTDSITSYSPISLTIQDNTDIGQLSQSHQNVTSDFSNVLTTGTHNGTANYTNEFIKIDKAIETDSTTIVSTGVFNPTAKTFTLNANGATSYEFTAWADRFAHGRNKKIFIDLPNGSSNTNANIQLRYQDSNNVWACVYIGSSGIGIIQKFGGSFTNIYGPFTFASFSTTKKYTMFVKSYENLVCYGILDPVNFPTTAIKHSYAIDNTNYQTITGVNNGLGINTGSITFQNFKADAMDNFLSVLCVGDSNTQNPDGLVDTGADYVSLLNYQFRDRNVYFQNHGVSGYTTYEMAQGGSQDVYNTCLNYGVKKAKNVVTVLLGTNDAAENNGHTWNFAQTCANINYIVKTCHEFGFQVWFCTYFPRNIYTGITTAVMVQRVMQINNYIRQLSSQSNKDAAPDKIIDLWSKLVDKTYYDSTNNIERCVPSYLNSSDLLHLSATGANIVFQEFAKVVWKELASNTNSSNANVNSTLTMSDSVAPLIQFSNNGVAAPRFNSSSLSRSLGTKIVLYNNISSSQLDYGIGVANNQTWFSSGGSFGFYGNSISPSIVLNDTTTSIGATASVPSAGSASAIGTATNAQLVINGVNGATMNGTILFPAGGLAIPNSSTRSLGSRIILYPGSIGSACDFAIGMANPGGTGTIWIGTAANTDQIQLYNGTSVSATITGALITLSNPVSITDTTQSISTTTGSTIISGGLGVKKNIYGATVYSNALQTITTAGTNLSSSGAVLNVVSNPTFSGITTVSNVTNATSTTTGSTIISGGLGVAKDIWAANVYSGGALSLTTAGTNLSSSGAVLNVIAGPTFSGITNISNATASSSVSTGALTVTGGLGVQGNIYGGTVYSNALQTITTAGTNLSSSGAVLNVIAGPTFSGITTVSNATAISSTSNTVTGALNVGGAIALTSTSSLASTIMFTGTQQGFPTLTNRSAGTRIVLAPGITSSFADAAIGYVASGGNFGVWYGTSNTTDKHYFYNGTNQTATITAAQTAFNNSLSVSTSNGSFYSPITTITNTASTVAPYCLSLLGPNVTSGGQTGFLMGQSISNGNVSQFNFNYTGNNSSNNSFSFNFYGGGGSNFTMMNNTSVGFILNGGSVSITNSTNATSSSTGSLVLSGGLGVAKDIYGANIYSNGVLLTSTATLTGGTNISVSSGTINLVNSPTISQGITLQTNLVSPGSTLSGSILGFNSHLNLSGNVDISSQGISQSVYAAQYIDSIALSASSATTVGVGAMIYVNNAPSVFSNVTFTNRYSIYVNGGIMKINDSTSSTSSTSGALQVVGGIATQDNLNVGGSITANSKIIAAKSTFTSGGVSNGGTVSFSPEGPAGLISVSVSGLTNTTPYTYTVTHSYVTSTSVVLVTSQSSIYNAAVTSTGSGTFGLSVAKLTTGAGSGNILIGFLIV